MIRSATFFMRAAVLFIGAVVLVFAIFLFAEISREASLAARLAAEQIAGWLDFIGPLFVFGLYAAALPFFAAIYQTFKLLGYIDRKEAFSNLSVRALGRIKACAFSVCLLYMLGVMPLIFCFAQLDDAPGLILIGFIIGLSPFTIAAFTAILQKLLQEAIAFKAENDLTI